VLSLSCRHKATRICYWAHPADVRCYIPAIDQYLLQITSILSTREVSISCVSHMGSWGGATSRVQEHWGPGQGGLNSSWMPWWGRKFAPFSVFSAHLVTNHVGLFYYCYVSLLALKRRHWSLCCMAAIPCMCTVVTCCNYLTCSHHYNFKISAMISEHGKSVDTINEIFYYYQSCCWLQFCLLTTHCTGSLHHACTTPQSNCWSVNCQLHFNNGPLLSSEPQSYNFMASRISMSRKSTSLKKSSSDWSNLVK